MSSEAKKAVDIIKGAEVIQRGGKYVAIPYSDVSTILSALEAERGEQEKADQDALMYGQSFMQNGKRIDPNDVYTHQPAVAGDIIATLKSCITGDNQERIRSVIAYIEGQADALKEE